MEYYLSVVVFAFAGALTPGPNTIMLVVSGVNFGLRRSLPHYLGVCLGFPLMLLAVGAGLGSLFIQFPLLHTLLKFIGGAYLLYLAWRISQAGAPQKQEQIARPLNFWQAAAFQWVNPKAWIVAVGGIATFTQKQQVVESIAIILLVFTFAGFIAMAMWLTLGARLEPLLRGRRVVIFNYVMAILLALTVIPMVLTDLRTADL